MGPLYYLFGDESTPLEMLSRKILFRLGEIGILPYLGQRGKGLLWLAKHGWMIPPTWLCPGSALDQYCRGRQEFAERLARELRKTLDLSQDFAVRSSANMEDGTRRSFVGQFVSVLNVLEERDIMAALRTVWESAQSSRVQDYASQDDAPLLRPQMSSLLQPMVNPGISGVSFSCNPLTGREEVVLESVVRSGEKLHQEGMISLRGVDQSGK
jgi:phosphoenolpyruvate synthase/pyruvate phosphate dikinase